jgi:phage pi2 protein 07
MRKLIRYFFIFVFGTLWFLGCSKDAAKYLFDNKIILDDYRYGDLYRLSNLPDFRVLVEKCKYAFSGKKVDATLYLAGDSFTEDGRIFAENFASNEFVRGFAAEPNSPLILKPGKKILVIETVERHLRERFTEPWKNWDVKKEGPIVGKTTKEKLLELKIPYNSQLHESVVFGSDFVFKIKEMKAQLNLKLFGKTDDKVALSKSKEHLLYYFDTNPGISSSFEEVPDSEIQQMVSNMNETYTYYKGLGFDEVYLSIIPNKTSILAPDLGEYNHLVERIESNKALKMPIIGIFNDFKGKNYYLKGDSHWNCQGQQIWIDKVNEKLVQVQ